MAKDPRIAAALGLILGPFGYLYFKKYKRFFAGLLAFSIFSAIVSYSWIILFFFAYDCYYIAKRSDEGEKKKEIEKIEEIHKRKGKILEYIFCSQCGKKNVKNAKVCSKCGEKI